MVCYMLKKPAVRVLFVAGLALFFLTGSAGLSLAGGGAHDITLIHVNDTHTHLDPVEAEFDLNGAKIFFDNGGYAKLAAMIKALRPKATPTLLLHAGDTIQGSLYGVKYQGTAAIDFMNFIGFDAMTLGNHEFDFGPEILSRRISRATFPILGANVDTRRDRFLNGMVKPFIVREFNGWKVGVIGLTTRTTATSSRPGPDVSFKNVSRTAAACVDRLRAAGVNCIIALTHLGYAGDIDLARQVPGIDVIVGGHSHSLLGGPFEPLNETVAGDYPTREFGPDRDPVYIVQAWAYSKAIGVLNVSFDGSGVVTRCTGRAVIPADRFLRDNSEGKKVPVDRGAQAEITRRFSGNGNIEIVADDPATARRIAGFQLGVAEWKQTVIGRTVAGLSGGFEVRIPTPGNPAGCQIAPHVLNAMILKAKKFGLKVDLAFQNAGSFRAPLRAGDITVADVYNCLPFGNTLVVMELTGRQLREVLETGVGNAAGRVVPSTGAFPYLGNARYTVDTRRPPGSRVVRLDVLGESGKYRPVQESRVYRMITNSYLAEGHDGYDLLKAMGGRRSDTGFVNSAVFIDYVREKRVLDPLPTNVDLDGLMPYK